MAQEKDDSQADSVFRALADSTRRRILRDLRKGELAAGDIASHFPISGPSVSRHLAVLKAAGLVTERRQANKVIYSLVPERLVLTVGSFLTALSTDSASSRSQRKKKGKAPDKAPGKDKDKSGSTGHAGHRTAAGAKLMLPPEETSAPARAEAARAAKVADWRTGPDD